MCGINGFISKRKIEDGEYRINSMNDSLIHRGPDAEGYIEIDGGYMGQRRLSIIDQDSRSNQPMWTNENDAAIVYNGEIYNYTELKEGLCYKFKTKSDTEVLLAGIKECGIDWVKKCNGMFAFAFADIRENKVILCRDRLGIKPLYYYIDKEKLIFSSEIKGILNSGLIEAKFNSNAIDEYLGNRHVREPYTFFQGIYQVPAGHYLIINSDLEMKAIRYWNLPDEFNMDLIYDENEIYDRFKCEVVDAIKRRMIADVPIGTFLSGGVDSSIISAVCAKQSNESINTYTIGFPEINEFSYAQMVAQQYRTNHHELLLSAKDYFDKLEELISYKDGPLGVPNEVPLAIMSKELKKIITVVLSGEGADELMGGYGKIYRSPFDFENIDCCHRKGFYDYFINKYEYVPRKIRDRYLFTSHFIRDEKDEEIRQQFDGRINEENVFRFFHQYHIAGLLQRVDTMTMYAGIEARVPFLDHTLIEFVYKEVPYELKLRWNSDKVKERARKSPSSFYSEKWDQPKYLLRRLGLELLPEDVVNRKKMGFPVPLNIWFEELKEMGINLLKNSDWFDYTQLKKLYEDCKKNIRSGQLLWMFINVELFRKMYFEKKWRY